MIKLLHRVLSAPTTERARPRGRFPLGAYVREKRRQEKNIIEGKLQLSNELSHKQQELQLLEKEVHAIEEKVRRKRKRVSLCSNFVIIDCIVIYHK